MNGQTLTHPFPPVADGHCTTLILGSFPSVRSRQEGFFYGHPRNRFWKTLACVYGAQTPETVPEKKAFLLSRHIALWDAAAACTVEGSSDASIRAAVPTDLAPLLAANPIRRVFCNGTTAGKLFLKFHPGFPLPVTVLPSTSPANAAWTQEKLNDAWMVIKNSSS